MGTTFAYDNLDDAIEAQKRGKRRLGMHRRGDLLAPPTVENLPLWLISGGTRGLRESVNPSQAPISLLIDGYLESRRKRVEEDDLSHQSHANDIAQLDIFRVYCDQQKIDTISEAVTEESLDAFKVFVKTYSPKDKPDDFERAPASVWHAVKRVKHMVEWGWSKRYFNDPPRNLKEFGNVPLGRPKAKTYTADELATLYQKAGPRFKLYILLAINCGYQQIDIATLERSMVDWETGIIARNRHKTGVPQHSRLWPITLEMLRKYAEPEGDILLKSRDGNPLLWHKLRDDGRVWRSDCIQRAFNRLRKQCGGEIATKSFTDIRNTGASRIKNQYNPEQRGTKSNQELFDLYLGHAPHKMIASYDEGDWLELFKASDWLATLYKWEDTPQHATAELQTCESCTGPASGDPT